MPRASALLERESEEKPGKMDRWTCGIFLFLCVIYNVFPPHYIPYVWASENIGFFRYR